MARIVLQEVTKRFGKDVVAVDRVSMEIADGEFMVLVGPSGCGKTTLLRIIACLEEVSDGEVVIGDRIVTDLAPKHRDIAILKTMGANARSVTVIFVMQGVIIGIIGTAVGATAGYILASILDRYKLIKIPMDVYQVSHVPFKVLPFDLAMVVLAAVLVCLVATIYPSRQAARLDPAQALRYE